jgi:predicted patatin/cPLA2 family phospholipase
MEIEKSNGLAERTRSVVAGNILVKARQEPHDGDKLKTGILCTGGSQTGAFSAGVLFHLHEMGLSNKFDVAVGISASAPNIANFLTPRGKLAISTYWEDNLDGLINPWRFWKIVDIARVEYSMRYRKVLDVEELRSNPTQFYVAVTDTEGRGELVDVKASPDMIDPIIATCSLPLYWNRPRRVNGKLYLDGAVSLPLPAEEVADRFSLTDLLIILNHTNENLPEELPYFEKIVASCTLGKFYSRSFKQAYLRQDKVYNRCLERVNSGILSSGCRVAVIAPSFNISKVCTDAEALKEFAEEGKRQAREFFSETNSVRNVE